MVAHAQPTSALLVSNPNSRSSDPEGLQSAIARLEQAFELIVVDSKSAQQTRAEIERHCSKVSRVILAGGDGTISSAASALHHHKLPLAILPTGTANDLARALDIPTDLAAAAEIAVHGVPRRIDLGLANGHCFINVAHLGLGVRVTHRLQNENKGRWGVFSYLHAMLSELAHARGFSVELDIDGRSHRLKTVQLAVGNGRYYGGGNVVDEDSQPDDGKLNLYSVRPRPWALLLALAPALRYGRHREDEHIFSAAGQSIRIRTSKPREVHADGEPLTQTPVEFSIKPAALEVLVPADCIHDDQI